MNHARFTHASLLSSHRFADISQVALRAMPVKAIPLPQGDLHIRLRAAEINGTLGLPLQTADARFKLRHNIEYTFKITFSVFESLKRIIAA